MIFLNDSYIKEFQAPIVAVEEEKIMLPVPQYATACWIAS